MRKIIIFAADLFALVCAGLWFGAYRWWMFYGFFVFVIIIEVSCRYLYEQYGNSKDGDGGVTR